MRERLTLGGKTEKLFRVAGWPAVQALFATTPERVERLFFDDRWKVQTAAYCSGLAQRRKIYRLVGKEELDKVAGTPLHGGVVAVATMPDVDALDLQALAGWAKARQPLLLLDGVGNPHNLGAIARTMAFFGLKHLILSDHPGQASLSEAAFRVAEGGLSHVSLYRAGDFAASLGRIGSHYQLLATALGKGGKGIEDLLGKKSATAKPLAIILGNEEEGLPAATIAACAATLTIPGSGAVQSLNVSATAAILIHALANAG